MALGRNSSSDEYNIIKDEKSNSGEVFFDASSDEDEAQAVIPTSNTFSPAFTSSSHNSRGSKTPLRNLTQHTINGVSDADSEEGYSCSRLFFGNRESRRNYVKWLRKQAENIKWFFSCCSNSEIETFSQIINDTQEDDEIYYDAETGNETEKLSCYESCRDGLTQFIVGTISFIGPVLTAPLSVVSLFPGKKAIDILPRVFSSQFPSVLSELDLKGQIEFFGRLFGNVAVNTPLNYRFFMPFPKNLWHTSKELGSAFTGKSNEMILSASKRLWLAVKFFISITLAPLAAVSASGLAKLSLEFSKKLNEAWGNTLVSFGMFFNFLSNLCTRYLGMRGVLNALEDKAMLKFTKEGRIVEHTNNLLYYATPDTRKKILAWIDNYLKVKNTASINSLNIEEFNHYSVALMEHIKRHPEYEFSEQSKREYIAWNWVLNPIRLLSSLPFAIGIDPIMLLSSLYGFNALTNTESWGFPLEFSFGFACALASAALYGLSAFRVQETVLDFLKVMGHHINEKGLLSLLNVFDLFLFHHFFNGQKSIKDRFKDTFATPLFRITLFSLAIFATNYYAAYGILNTVKSFEEKPNLLKIYENINGRTLQYLDYTGALLVNLNATLKFFLETDENKVILKDRLKETRIRWESFSEHPLEQETLDKMKGFSQRPAISTPSSMGMFGQPKVNSEQAKARNEKSPLIENGKNNLMR